LITQLGAAIELEQEQYDRLHHAALSDPNFDAAALFEQEQRVAARAAWVDAVLAEGQYRP
jgi:hypothetical protein